MHAREPTLRPADDHIAYDWFSWVPPHPSVPAVIWITGLHGNIATDDSAVMTAESRSLIERLDLVARAQRHGFILLVPVIPRPIVPERQSGYAILLLRQVFGGAAPAICQRPDLQVIRMIDLLRRELLDDGLAVAKCVPIDGFSAGGMFAQRFTLLHPERVQAAAVGHAGGALTLPETHLDGEPLPWPLGVHDFTALNRQPCDRDAYRAVPQLVSIGDQDTTNSTVWLPGELWPTQQDIDFLNRTFGDTNPLRLANQVHRLNDLGYANIAFRLYSGVGHTVRPMLADVLESLATHRDSAR